MISSGDGLHWKVLSVAANAEILLGNGIESYKEVDAQRGGQGTGQYQEVR
jgi:hypothetical protein